MRNAQLLSNLANHPNMEQALHSLPPDEFAALDGQLDKLTATIARLKALNEKYKSEKQQPAEEDTRTIAEIHGHGGFSGCGFSSDEEECNRRFTSEAEDEFAFKARGWRHEWEDRD